MMPGFSLADYEPVEDRIAKFYADHPLGRITTEMVHVGPDGYIVKAFAYRDSDIDSVPDATGYAQEAVTERGVNATSALENCETSAIGRALANLGYAAKGKRPSREEMSKASAETTAAVGDSKPGGLVPPSPAAARTATNEGGSAEGSPAREDPLSSGEPTTSSPPGGGDETPAGESSATEPEGRSFGEGDDPKAPTRPIGRRADWRKVKDQLGVPTLVMAQQMVQERLKHEGLKVHLSEIDEDMAALAVGGILRAKERANA